MATATLLAEPFIYEPPALETIGDLDEITEGAGEDGHKIVMQTGIP